ncbi:MAG TPA: SRPBCC domain-containing protein [Ktedonobacterales bacterium]
MEITERAGQPDVLTLVAEYLGVEPERMWAYWTEPGLLVRWWPRKAETDVRDGGAYHLAWPEQGFHLRGRYTAVDPGWLLAFTWAWDGEPEESLPKLGHARFRAAARRSRRGPWHAPDPHPWRVRRHARRP